MWLVPLGAPAPQALCQRVGRSLGRNEHGARDGRPATDVVGHLLAFHGEWLRDPGEGRQSALLLGAFRANSEATPQTIDFAHAESELKGKTWLGIYKLDGDTLTICDNAPNTDKGRPSAFETSSGSGPS